MDIDTSTVNMKRMALLPAYKKPPTYKISEHMGNGCAGDPPGYPTYFTRSIYTQSGNSPRQGTPQMLLFGRVVDNGKVEYEEVKKLLRKMWKPLPLDHARTQAWIRATFIHHRHCYHVPGHENFSWHSDERMLIWPGGCLGQTPFGTLKDLDFEIKYAQQNSCYDKWTQEEKHAFMTQISEANVRIRKDCEAVAVPENAIATILVRRYYPDFVPTPDLFDNELTNPGSWWERLPRQPTPEECPGTDWAPHPCNKIWCQVCGWHAEAEKEG